MVLVLLVLFAIIFFLFFYIISLAIVPTTETIAPARSIRQTPPSKSEIVSAIKSLGSDKATGIDGISAEFYKSYMAAEMLQSILEGAFFERSVYRGMHRWYDCENSKNG